LFSNVSLPQDFDLSINDIVGAFAELNSLKAVLLADVISITAKFTMSDGTVLNILNDDSTNNTSTNIQTTSLFTTIINYSVSCPSDIGGVYDVVSNGDNTDGQPPAVNVPYTVHLQIMVVVAIQFSTELLVFTNSGIVPLMVIALKQLVFLQMFVVHYLILGLKHLVAQ